jgi:membrane fusion protein (multidrug efflux system)
MADEQKPSRRRHIPWLIGAAVVILIVVAGLWYYYAGRESTDDAQIDGHLTPLATRVGGTIAAVNVADNQAVEAGTLLVQIDPRDYQVALDRAKADLAEAEAAFTAARTDVPVATTTTESATETAESERASAEARVRSARARLREAQAQETKATADLDRLKQLLAKDEVSRQEYDAVAVAAEGAHAARETAEADVRQAEQGLGAAGAKLRQAHTAPQQIAIIRAKAASAEARVAQARGAVARAELDLARTSLKAPVAGIVSKKTVEVGQVVQPGQPVLSIVTLDDVWVTANFKESQLHDIRPGQPVKVSVDAYGGRTFRGHVDSVSPATGAKFSLLPPENASGNYVKVVQRVPVKIVFEPGENSEHLLRPGMSVVPTVLLR